MATFTDTHAHIHFDNFSQDIDNIINRSLQNGINRIVTIGINVDDSIKAVELANKHDNIYAAVGVHPQDCKDFNDKDYNKLLELSKNKKVIAIGEIGLDYYREYVKKHKQISTFESMLELSKVAKKPVIIHNREANSDCIAIMDDMLGGGKGNGGIFHCFSGGLDVIKWALDNNFFISFAGQITYKSATDLRDNLKYVPLDRIFIETDCPYLAPVPKRGKSNEPSYAIYTAEFIAKEFNISIEEFSSYTENNFNSLFGRQIL